MEYPEWIDVKNIPLSNYQVSPYNKGVKNKTTGKILTGTVKKTGYICYHLQNDQGKSQMIYGHRLVALSCFGLPDNETKRHVNHKDKNRSNNHVNNLEWVTPKENSIHKNLNGTNQKGNPKYERRVIQIKDGEIIARFNNLSEASKETGVDISTISSLALGRITRDYGFEFKYEEIVDIEGEIWKEFETKYMISNMGRMKKNDRLLHGHKDSFGYIIFNINKKARRAHVLVAELFCENFDNKPIVNHINGKKDDNRFINLEWVTSKENRVHAVETGLVKQKKVIMLDKDGNKVKQFNSPKDVGEYIGCTRNKIYKEIYRKNGINGYYFIYEGTDISDWNEYITKPPPKIPNRKIKRVIMIDEDGNEVMFFNSVEEASKSIGCTRQRIYDVLCKRLKESGHYFKYEDEDDFDWVSYLEKKKNIGK